ncbi:hypothetical protein J437_LFUL015787 [Ladona fulva]|uniref:MADF domain-containing protein n=1 Tax=Ladona fulva TaxID=123851 RepID=A0A8K0KJK5_LADFU|nr:hypothetical protein J437_LFUL015787 [Ladona fulva]
MARKDWMREEVFQLIALFEEEGILWNLKSLEYRNREKKQRVVEENAIKFNCTANEIQRKWHNLRNQGRQFGFGRRQRRLSENSAVSLAQRNPRTVWRSSG